MWPFFALLHDFRSNAVIRRIRNSARILFFPFWLSTRSVITNGMVCFSEGVAPLIVFVCNYGEISYIHNIPINLQSLPSRLREIYIWDLPHVPLIFGRCGHCLLHCRRKWVWLLSPYLVLRQINNNNINNNNKQFETACRRVHISRYTWRHEYACAHDKCARIRVFSYVFIYKYAGSPTANTAHQIHARAHNMQCSSAHYISKLAIIIIMRTLFVLRFI